MGIFKFSEKALVGLQLSYYDLLIFDSVLLQKNMKEWLQIEDSQSSTGIILLNFKVG